MPPLIPVLARVPLSTCSFLSRDQGTMNIGGPFFFVLMNSTSEKELANLGQAPIFLPSDMQQGSLDLTGHPEADAFVFRCHDFARILGPPAMPGKSFFLLTQVFNVLLSLTISKLFRYVL